MIHSGASETDAVSSAGRLTWMVVPHPSFDSTVTNPPWFLTIECEVARPRPLPFCLVLKYGSKMLPRFSSGMPMPVSVTDTRT